MDIPIKTLKALLLIAADRDVRYYLNGVYVEPRGDAGAILVATDGHRLLAVREECGGPVDGPSYIIPRDLIEQAMKGVARKQTLITVTAQLIDGVPTVTVGNCVAPAIDGKFPDWRRILPKAKAPTAGTTAQFNGEYYRDFCMVRKLLTGNPYMVATLRHNGPDSPLLVEVGPDAVGVMMPVRSEGMDLPDVPDWVDAAPAASEASAA